MKKPVFTIEVLGKVDDDDLKDVHGAGSCTGCDVDCSSSCCCCDCSSGGSGGSGGTTGCDRCTGCDINPSLA